MTLRTLPPAPCSDTLDHDFSIVSGRGLPHHLDVDAAAGAIASHERDALRTLRPSSYAVAEHERDASRIAGSLVLGAPNRDVDDVFAPLPFAAFLSKDLKWCAGRPSTIVGARGSGKTTAIQSAILSLASGTRPIWNHFQVGRRARVLHLDHDHGIHATQRRYQKLAVGMGLSREDLRGHLRVVHFPKIRLTDRRARDLYRHAVEGFDLCILDSLRGFMTSADENDARIREVFDRVLLPVSEVTGCAFVVLHHMGEGGAQERDNEADDGGSAGILGGLGSQLRFTLTTGGARTDLRRVRLVHGVSRGTGQDCAPFYLEFEDVADNDAVNLNAGVRVVYRAEEQAKMTRRSATARDQVLSYVREQTSAHEPVHGIEALAKAIHVHRRTVSEAVAQLERDKLIVNEPERIGHGAPKPRLWACSAADFTRPPHPAADGRPAS